jgi:hypothetical protein
MSGAVAIFGSIEEREGCHVTQLGWNSQLCGEFSFHVRADAVVLYRNSEDFSITF